MPKAAAVILEFTSALELRFEGSEPAIADAALWSLLSSLGNRASGLAQRQNVEVVADWAALKEQVPGIELECFAMTSEIWQDRAFRLHRRIPMHCDRPVLRFAGALGPFLRWVALERRRMSAATPLLAWAAIGGWRRADHCKSSRQGTALIWQVGVIDIAELRLRPSVLALERGIPTYPIKHFSKAGLYVG